MSDSKDGAGDVFKQSLEESLKNKVSQDIKETDENIEDSVILIDDKDRMMEEIRQRIESNNSEWDVLAGMVEGGFTKRFMNVMANMSDKDFVKNYLKLLEHFKPKLMRSEGGKGNKQDTTINIQTLIINPETNEPETIELTDIKIYTDNKNGLNHVNNDNNS